MRRKPFLARALLLLLALFIPATPVPAAEDIILLLTTQDGEVSSGRGVDIFHNDDLDDKVVKPGSNGTFAFTITNPEAFAVDFRLAVSEENLHGVPIEFSLQVNGATVEEDGDVWLSAEALADHEECLAAGAKKEMALHWRWLYTLSDERDIYDTGLGGSAGATAAGAYALLLDIYAEQSEQPAAQTPATGTNEGAPYKARNTRGANSTHTSTPKGAGSKSGARVQTGDTSASALLPALALGAFTALTAFILLRKRAADPQKTREEPPW